MGVVGADEEDQGGVRRAGGCPKQALALTHQYTGANNATNAQGTRSEIPRALCICCCIVAVLHCAALHLMSVLRLVALQFPRYVMPWGLRNKNVNCAALRLSWALGR
eukprot:637929-Pyramimonas_sp.AAC.1